MGFVWIAPPSRIADRLDRLSGAEAAIGEVAQRYAGDWQSRLATQAPWNDQTGNARQGMFGRAEGTTIVGGGVMDYNLWLETGTKYMAPRAVIVPTMNEIAPEYFDAGAEVVMRLLGGA